MLSGIPFDGPIGAVRVAWSTEGTWIPHPTYQEGDASCFELVVAGRALSEEPGAEIAIMMVEAGGTEDSWKYYEAGAPQVTEEVLAEGLEAAKTWIRESIELQRELVAKVGQEAHHPLRAVHRLRRRRLRRGWRRSGTDAVAKANTITEKAERNAALDEATDVDHRRAGAGVPRARARDQGGGALAHQEDRPQADRRGRHPHRRPRHRRHPAACRPRSGSSPPRTARGCSSGARPRCSTSPPWACPA